MPFCLHVGVRDLVETEVELMRSKDLNWNGVRKTLPSHYRERGTGTLRNVGPLSFLWFMCELSRKERGKGCTRLTAAFRKSLA